MAAVEKRGRSFSAFFACLPVLWGGGEEATPRPGQKSPLWAGFKKM